IRPGSEGALPAKAGQPGPEVLAELREHLSGQLVVPHHCHEEPEDLRTEPFDRGGRPLPDLPPLMVGPDPVFRAAFVPSHSGAMIAAFAKERWSEMRLFIAVEVDPAVRSKILREAERLRGLAPQAKWVNPSGIHVTLVFIGQLADERVPEVKTILEEVASRHAPLSIRAQGIGGFGGCGPRREL